MKNMCENVVIHLHATQNTMPCPMPIVIVDIVITQAWTNGRQTFCHRTSQNINWNGKDNTWRTSLKTTSLYFRKY